jgi:hypothetical protein
MALYTGDTITIQATVAGAPTITAHLIRFYDANGKQVGKYTQADPEWHDLTGGVYTIAHQSQEQDQASYTTLDPSTIPPSVVRHNWKCHWQITVAGVVDSEELDIVVNE